MAIPVFLVSLLVGATGPSPYFLLPPPYFNVCRSKDRSGEDGALMLVECCVVLTGTRECGFNCQAVAVR
jgi:hypothetical protein